MKPRRIAQCTVMAGLFVGCGAPADEATDAGDGGATAWSQIEACGLAGRFRVLEVAPAPTCEGLPGPQDEIAVRRRGVGAFLVFGVYEVPAAFDADQCQLAAAGCLHDEEAGRYARQDVTLSRVQDNLTLEIRGEVIVDHRRLPCPNRVTVTAAPVAAGGCGIEGTFEITDGPTLKSGSCDLRWPSATITVASGAQGYSVSWSGGTSFDDVSVDTDACRLTAEKGEQGLYIYNGALRTVRLAMTFAGDSISGEIDDAVQGQTDQGQTCAGTFSFAAAREKSQAGGTLLSSPCTEPRPYVCGDGLCEAELEEGCLVCQEDCGCSTGEQCAGAEPGRCLLPCDFWTENCPTGRRCDYLDEAIPYASGDPAYCVPEGRSGLGDRCREHHDCGRGLICQYPGAAGFDGYGICLERCRPGQPGECSTACEEHIHSTTQYLGGCMLECDATQKGSCKGKHSFCWRRYANVQPYCWGLPEKGLPGLGEDCVSDEQFYSGPQCGETLKCIGTMKPDGTHWFCTKKCTWPSQCPEALPECDSSLGYCLP